jgi:hypothetical protein
MRALMTLLKVLFLILGLAMCVALPLFIISRDLLSLPEVWIVTIVVLALALAVAGLLTQKRSPLATVVNKENRLSFSQLQMLCWWVMLVSATLVVASARYEDTKQTILAQAACRSSAGDQEQPTEEECAALAKTTTVNWLDISIPEGLLAAAGLAIGAAAVTSVINGVKQNPSEKQTKELYLQTLRLCREESDLQVELRETAKRYSEKQTDGDRHTLVQGKINLARASRRVKAYDYANRHGYLMVADKPAISHLFLGNEVGNWEDLDWARVQALLLSAVLIGLYGLAIWRMLSFPDVWIGSDTVSFPAFSGALAALLTISLAGYEANKVPNHSVVEPAGSSTSAPTGIRDIDAHGDATKRLRAGKE